MKIYLKMSLILLQMSVLAISAVSANVVPLPPTGIHAWSNGPSTVVVGWDPSPTAQAYNLYYRPSAPGVNKTNGTQVANVASGVVINGLTTGLCYYFVVTSLNGGVESAESNEVCATPYIPAP